MWVYRWNLYWFLGRRTGVRKITGLKLFHNHMTIELLVPYLGFTEEMWKLSDRFRMDFLKLWLKVIWKAWSLHTFGHLTKSQIGNLLNKFVRFSKRKGQVRILSNWRRILKSACNATNIPIASNINRQSRNINLSVHNLLETMAHHRLNSYPGEIKKENYLRINNTNLSAADVAKMIKERFRL